MARVIVRLCGSLLMLAGGMALWATDAWTLDRGMALVVLLLGSVVFAWFSRRPRVRR
jgi:hypothetical protein